MFDQLNLPQFKLDINCIDDAIYQVFDRLRGKFVVLTPEEWVRQHFVNYLIEHLNFPATLMANEVGLKLNDTQRRCDTLIYTRDLRPLCIVEYKRATVEITSAVFDQIARYNSVIGAPYLIVSNGIRHFCCRFNGSNYKFLKNIPSYLEMTELQ